MSRDPGPESGSKTTRPPNQPSQGEGVMNYVDGFVAAVPTANREAFRKHAEAAAQVFKDYGALTVMEC
jgi:hypothetical protein